MLVGVREPGCDRVVERLAAAQIRLCTKCSQEINCDFTGIYFALPVVNPPNYRLPNVRPAGDVKPRRPLRGGTGLLFPFL